MKCYRNCKEECNELKVKYCIFRLTKEQQELIAKIKGLRFCDICGNTTVKGKYKGQAVELCTSCGRVWKDNKVIRKCLISKKRRKVS